MTLTDLRYIVALAETLHFGRAAEKCFVAQPTLSTAVKKLEDELGTPLFERGAEVRITPVGEAVVAQARRVLAEAARVKELAQAGQDPLRGPLKLGAIYTVGPYLLPRLIPLLHAHAPAMPLLIQENFTTRLAELLRAGELDAIVVALPFEAPGIVVAALYDEPFRMVAAAGHAWATRERIAPAMLAEEPLLLLGAGNCFRDQVLQVCPRLREPRENGLPRTVEGSSLETIRHMVASGMGVTVLPSSAADPLIGTNPLLAVRPIGSGAGAGGEPFRRVALAWRSSFPRHAAIDLLRRCILDCALPGTTAISTGTKLRPLPEGGEPCAA